VVQWSHRMDEIWEVVQRVWMWEIRWYPQEVFSDPHVRVWDPQFLCVGTHRVLNSLSAGMTAQDVIIFEL